MQLSDPITKIAGVGPKLAELLAKCQIHKIQDLLFHLPYRYQDRTRITPIRDLREHDWTVIEGQIINQEQKQGKRRQLIIHVQDHSHLMQLRFFHFYPELKQHLAQGNQIRAFGEVRRTKEYFEMVHPDFHVISQEHIPTMEEYLTPIYSTTQGLTQKKLRQLIDNALVLLSHSELELLPAELIIELNLPTLKDSLHFLHHPPPNAPVLLIEEKEHPCQQRLALEELLSHHLSFKRIRQMSQQKKAQSQILNPELKEKFIKQLPFTPTNAQQRVIEEIEQDLQKNAPMHRLIQGDVGSGKTLVAAFSCLPCLNNNGQIALMAPTELLAEQLFKNFSRWFNILGIETLLLLGKQTTKQKKLNIERLLEAKPLIIVGTHALFQQDVHFANLQLIIIDEQHRFGVKQRLSLQEKGCKGELWPHQLIMTATPIPRTLAMTKYTRLDISIIDELPPGRTPIQTAVLDNNKRDQIIERLKTAFAEKKQAYWVCTLIEESETLQCQAAQDSQEMLAKLLAPYKIGLVHGRMKAKEKADAMQDFVDQKLDLLVATTVIEVGVDVPNASLMIIENSERLGLSQLHQLRGRVGRGSQKSFCILLYQTPLSKPSKARLEAIRSSTDGFVIADEDLKLRGSGEIIGTKQTGLIQMKVANFQQHQSLLSHIPKLSEKLCSQYPDNIEPLIKRWLADGERYVDS